MPVKPNDAKRERQRCGDFNDQVRVSVEPGEQVPVGPDGPEGSDARQSSAERVRRLIVGLSAGPKFAAGR